MAELIVHIGAGKCGSSAIQASLSSAPCFVNRAGTNFRYVATDSTFEALDSTAIVKKASLARSGYVKSPGVRRLGEATEDHWAAFRNSLSNDLANGSTLVLSNEDYYLSTHVFSAVRIFGRIGAEATIIAYVRPQVEYLNSAWWQWGAWTGEDFDTWLQKRFERAMWARLLVPWRNVPGIKKLIVRPLPKDIVSDIFEHVFVADVPSPLLKRRVVNRSLSAVALRVMQRHPALQGLEGINFLLESSVSGGGKAPWVLDMERTKKIIHYFKDDNLRLLSLMDSDARAMVESDARWWGAESYREKRVEPPHAIDAVDADLDKFAADLIVALASMDERMRRRATRASSRSLKMSSRLMKRMSLLSSSKRLR